MIRFRSALLVVVLAVHTAVTAAQLLVAAPFCKWHGRFRLLRLHARISRGLFRWICGLHATVTGLENLPDGPFVLVANHQSAWETMTLPGILPPFVWVLKESLTRVPWYGWGLRQVCPIAIDRSERRGALRKLRDEGLEWLAQGVCVVIFPEGTRSQSEIMGEFQSGAAMLAQAAKVPLVPLAHDAGRFWPGKTLRIMPGTVHVKIGAPITAHLDQKISTREILAQLRTEVEKLKPDQG